MSIGLIKWATRIALICTVIHGVTTISLYGAEPLSAQLAVVENGKACAVIVFDASAQKDSGREGARINEAVLTMVNCIRRGTGVELEVSATPPSGDLAQMHIGRTDYVKSFGLPPAGLDGDGFVIAFPEPGRMALVGGSDWGTEFAIYEFLERYVGVRWLFPGKLGEHVPKRPVLAIPVRDIRQSPVFFSRLISGREIHKIRKKKDENIWAYRLRMHGSIEFHHNMRRYLLPSAKYADAHPEWYPLVKGERITSDNPQGHNYQPIFDAPGVTEQVIANVKAWFQDNPDAVSCSLGINDSHNWGRPFKHINSLGIADYSDYYYGWVNQVAEGLEDDYPDKWLGLLAYNQVMDSPRNMCLHPRVIPYVCQDRMFWLNPGMRDRDVRRTREWREVAAQQGWYDYIYGNFDYHKAGYGYKVPRYYPHLMAEYLRFAASKGVRCYYAEAYPPGNWNEGPKLYVLLKLLWNPETDVESLLDEWYRAAVGVAAAPALKSYFEFWDDFWTRRVADSGWFYSRIQSDVYLPLAVHGYLAELTSEDMAACEGWMREVVALTATDEERERAIFLKAGWDAIKDDPWLAWFLRVAPAVKAFADPTNSQEVYTFNFKENPLLAPDEARRHDRWTFWQRVSAGAGHHRFLWDQDEGCDADGSIVVALDAEDNGNAAVIKRDRLPVESGRFYQVCCRVMVRDVNPDAAVVLTLRWTSKSYRDRTTIRSARVKIRADGEWSAGKVVGQAPNEQGLEMSIQLGVTDGRQGSIWVDEVEVRVLNEDVQASILSEMTPICQGNHDGV